jgi:hypothetical protein
LAQADFNRPLSSRPFPFFTLCFSSGFSAPFRAKLRKHSFNQATASNVTG